MLSAAGGRASSGRRRGPARRGTCPISRHAAPRRAHPRHHRVPVHHQRRLSALPHRLHARPMQHSLDPLARPARRTAAAGGASATRSGATAATRRRSSTTDIAPGVRTIFELVPESVGIFTPVARGLTPERDPSGRSGSSGARWPTMPSGTSRRTMRSPATCCARPDGPARFVFAQFPAVDGYTHQAHPDAAPVRRACGRWTSVVGRLRERLRRAGRAGADA